VPDDTTFNPGFGPNPLLAERARRQREERVRTAGRRYQAPAYPFGATVDSSLGPKPDVAVIVTSIVNIITTIKGSVPYDPNLGSQVPLLLFEPLDDITLSLIRYFTSKDISEQESRIAVRGVSARREGGHDVVVQVGFSIIGDPTARTFGVPVRLSSEAIGGI